MTREITTTTSHELVSFSKEVSVFSTHEQEIMDTEREETLVEWNDLYKDYSGELLDVFLEKYNVSSTKNKVWVNTNATKLIWEVFDKNVDDETLVITSRNDHDAVRLKATMCKNCLMLDYSDIKRMKISPIIEKAKNYKKVFVAIIGTSMTTGEYTPQLFFKLLKQELTDNGIPHKILLDDCQSMFIQPRDYSLFDYVIGTAHVLIPKYNMGILITKRTREKYGVKACNWLQQFLVRLEIILPKMDRAMLDFRPFMIEYFSGLLAYDDLFNLPNRVASQIFSIKVSKLKFDSELRRKLKDTYRISIENAKDSDQVWIRFRLSDILNTKEMVSGIKMLKNMIIDEVKKLPNYTNETKEISND